MANKIQVLLFYYYYLSGPRGFNGPPYIHSSGIIGNTFFESFSVSFKFSSLQQYPYRREPAGIGSMSRYHVQVFRSGNFEVSCHGFASNLIIAQFVA